MARKLPECLDTVIIGNGPSALVLSYILHGHIPYYVGHHHDSILHTRLSKRPCLLDLTPDLYAHFLSSLRYSTQALPVNTLLDTLLRPNADTEVNPKSCIEWRYEPEKAISHVAIGQTLRAGGQWAENPVYTSADIGTLSYAEQLSLPGYSYSDHLLREKRQDQSDFVRPSRSEVANYLSAYPEAVGISDAIFTGLQVNDVRRTVDGFEVRSLDLRCKHLVLASGIFTVNISPPPLFNPVASLDSGQEPLLVIGSGFSAADVIISTPQARKIIHIFHWAPDTRPSPLRGCHHTAYPEYATVYRQMKLSTLSSSKTSSARSPMLRRKSNPFFARRDWASAYEGLPNAEVLSVSHAEGSSSAEVKIRLMSGDIITRSIGGLEYVVGRRGSLDYLSKQLKAEVLGTNDGIIANGDKQISSRTLRSKAESSFEVAGNVFIIGSLAGDSLIRHAIGGCVFTAGRILGKISAGFSTRTTPSPTTRSSSPAPVSGDDSTASPQVASSTTTASNDTAIANGHSDLHLDRRNLARAVDVMKMENRWWVDSGWWAGGFGYSRADE